MDLDHLNALPAEEAQQALLDCCASAAWAEQMTRRRPFATADALLAAAREEWRALGSAGREAAFAAHPRIGERVAGDDRHAAWSRREQSEAEGAEAQVLDRLVACNRAYEARFDRVFLIFATGKTAAEMLESCEQRLGNDPEGEYEVASAEQEKIMDLRLRRLVGID